MSGGGFEKWLEANGETLPPCSCEARCLGVDAASHGPDCEREVYREHFMHLYRQAVDQTAKRKAEAMTRDGDPLSPARGVIWGLIAALFFWAIVTGITCARLGA